MFEGAPAVAPAGEVGHGCGHILTSYLHILTHQAGGPDLSLEAQCTPLV